MYKLQLLTFFTFANHFNILWIYLSWSPSLILNHEYKIQLHKIVTYLYFLGLFSLRREYDCRACKLLQQDKSKVETQEITKLSTNHQHIDDHLSFFDLEVQVWV